MPIRMEKDPEQDQPNDNNNDRRRNTGGGGFGSIMKFLPFIISFLVKRPKLLVPALIIGGALYFFSGSFSGGGGGNIADEFSTGMEMKEQVYDKAEVFEPLADGGKNKLPNAIDLEKYCPPRLNQGRQGSCVGWASSYAARTILHSRATGTAPRQAAFSPSYLYNQIALTGCQGAYMLDAMKTLKNGGVLPFENFGYNEGTCSQSPTRTEQQYAQQYRIRGFNRLTEGGSNYKTNNNAIKQNLAQGGPVVIGMQVGGSFMTAMRGQESWRPTNADYNMRGFGGHAMCVVGYDDQKNGGSFKIMNSWGQEWGNQGFGWVNYKDFDYFVKEAYGLYPMGSSTDNNGRFDGEFGLVTNGNKQYIGLQKVKGNVFRTSQPIRKGEKFKVEFTNTEECYTYIFGQETDGSSYVLFPYTAKHSPYCGIVGTRIFPRDHSMVADNVGSSDFVSIIITKQPIDYNEVNKMINASRYSSYADKVNDVIQNSKISNIVFQSGQTIKFSCRADEQSVIAMVLQIDKR